MSTTVATPTSELPSAAQERRLQLVNLVLELRAFIALIVLIAVFSVLSDAYLTWDNLVTMTRHVAINAILAIGMLMVILTGGIDLSVGSIVGLAGVVAGVLIEGLTIGFLDVVLFPPIWAVVLLVLATVAGAVLVFRFVAEERQRELLARLPSTLYRSFGLGTVCQALGGVLAGVPLREERAVRAFPGANQGAHFVFLDPARFIDPAVLKRELDDYHRLVAQLQPFAGTERATLPGRLEWERERRWATEGIPVGGRHREELAALAAEFGVPVPWSDPAS